jgi:hypothetical protein
LGKRLADRLASTVAPKPAALAGLVGVPMIQEMFVVTAADAAAIRTSFEQQGELSAAIELRLLYPGVCYGPPEAPAAANLSTSGSMPKPNGKIPINGSGVPPFSSSGLKSSVVSA